MGSIVQGTCYASVKSTATRFFISIFKRLLERIKMILLSIFYDSSNIQDIWDLILGILEIMLYWEDESMNWEKVRKSKDNIQGRNTRGEYKWVSSLLLSISLFLRKVICVKFSTVISADNSNWYLDFIPGHWAFSHHLNLQISKPNQIKSPPPLFGLLQYCCSNHCFCVSIFPYVYISCHGYSLPDCE